MMPNKRSNQGILEETAESASVAMGALVEVVSMGTKLPHGDMNPVAYAMKDGTLRALDRLDRSVEPYLYKFPSMIVNRDVMLATAREGYSCSTELANVLVREYELDYRTAHEIIHHFVTESAKNGVPSQEADIEILQAAAQTVINKKLDMSEQKLRQILDPVHFVEVTDSRGGVAPKEVARMIAVRKAKLVEARKRNLARIEKLEKAREKLLADLREFCETADQPKP
jgi:argininosuccinate lyase